MTSTLEERVALWTMDGETLANLCVNAACALRDTGQVQPVLHFYNDLMFGEEEQKILLFELLLFVANRLTGDLNFISSDKVVRDHRVSLSEEFNEKVNSLRETH